MSGDGLDAAEHAPGHGPAGPRIEDATVGHEESLTGRRLGRYRVGPVVHEGPMSTLYRAHDVGLDRPVALKVIGRELAADPEFRAQFVEEARALSAVDHPHVVPLYDHDEVDGSLFLAMRWVDGTTVRDQAGAGPMPLTQVLALFSQVASALDAVHARGLVHLDVKPANILVSRAAPAPTGVGHVYLADFGLTRRGFTAGMTSCGQFVGSPAFAAPEHLRGEQVTAAADVYGLACSLFMALTGRAPYDGSVNEVISGHLTGGCGRPSAARASTQARPEPGLAVGPATDAELARAMSPDPSARPASAGALLEGLRRSLAADAPRAPSASTPHEQRRVTSVHLGATARRTAAPTAPAARDPFGARSRHRPEPLLLALLDGRWGRPVELATASVIALLIVLVTVLAVI